MKRFLVRVLIVVVALEAAYLALGNLVLNVPLTQSLINRHRPEKYAVHWERAWSWYPLRLQASGISVNGQTASHQWQIDVASASASMAMLPLLRRTVRLDGVDTRDVALRLRPRPKPGKDYSAVQASFPPIRDRDPASPAVPRQPGRKGGNGWKIVVDDIRAQGNHDLWIHQARAALNGSVKASVRHETRGGPFSLRGGEIDAALQSITLSRDSDVSREGSIQGRFEIAPFVPFENPGLKSLVFLTAEADLDLPVGNLDFLEPYLGRFEGMEVAGRGRLRGHLACGLGSLIPGTRLAVAADELRLLAAPYEVSGAGGIDIRVDPDTPESMLVDIQFGELRALHREDQAALFLGKGLEVGARVSSRLLPDAAREAGDRSLAVIIPSVEVPDLRSYQRYLPEKWGVGLTKGKGSLQGHAELTPSRLDAELNLSSRDAGVRLEEYEVAANLDLGLKVSGGAAESATLDLAGSYLHLAEARLASEEGAASEPWQATFFIARGALGVPLADGETEASEFRQLIESLKGQGVKSFLSSADAELGAVLTLSDLGWVNRLFPNPFGFVISGAGEAEVDLKMRQGWLVEGSFLRVYPQGLRVQVLDYAARGKGLVFLAVERGGEQPSIRLDAQLKEAQLRRKWERDSFVEKVTMEVSATANGDAWNGGGVVDALDLRIPSAHVSNMSVYNAYLPKDSPLRILGGSADLQADVRLTPKSAEGFVKLEADALRSRLDDQEVSGRLVLDIEIRDGIPKDMAFDISGSSLSLDRFEVRGGRKSFDAAGWRAGFDLREARIVWRKPLFLDVEAGIEMLDSRPIVALFANHRNKHGWLDKILTVRNIRGEASLKIGSDRALVPRALVGSDKIDVGLKGLLEDGKREGIFYARFRGLHGILKSKDGERNFDILGAKDTFDAYVPGKTSFRLSGGGAEAPEYAPDSGGITGTQPNASGSPGRRETPPNEAESASEVHSPFREAFGGFLAE